MSEMIAAASRGGRRKNGQRRARKAKKPNLMNMPDEIFLRIMSFLDSGSLQALSSACRRTKELASQFQRANEEAPPIGRKLDQLPTEVLAIIISQFLTVKDVGRLSQVNKRFKEICDAEMTWSWMARECLVTNGRSPGFLDVTGPCPIWSSKERVRVSHNWVTNAYTETHLAVQSIRYMPRIQLQRSTLWVSWGKHIWSHPRRKDGSVHNTTNKVLKGHTDDVSKFVVREGCLISGGRDRALFGWNAETGEFMFSKRFCHGSEVSAVDIMTRHGLIVTGSRDKTVKIWTLDNSYLSSSGGDSSGGSADERAYDPKGRTFPQTVNTLNLRDRVWSLAADPGGRRVVVGTAGLAGVPSLHVIDLETLRGVAGDQGESHEGWLELGQGLKNGAGCLDVQWQSPNCFITCGYDSCTRLWDLRVNAPSGVAVWEEPFNEAIYSLTTDGSHTLLTGTARHGLVRLWDMRDTSAHVAHYYVGHPYLGQSSPVYSVAFDQRHMYAALDQSVNLLSFSALKPQGTQTESA